MKLDYATLISPYPLVLQKIGSIKSPTLKEIWNPEITYNTYQLYLILLLTTPQTYCETINLTKKEWYQTLTDKEKSALTMMYFISEDKGLQEQYCNVLEFFFEENVIWDDYNKVFITYTDTDDKGQVIPVGFIHNGIWNELCDVILQRCNINRKQKEEKPRFKSKIAKKIWLKTQKAKKQQDEKADKNVELPNLISAVSAFSKTLNFINVWDLTIYQLYDQFTRLRINVFFDISSTSVAAYGDSDNKFNSEQWYENIVNNQ